MTTENNALATIQPADLEKLAALAADGLTSENSKRKYRESIRDFIQWWTAQGRPPFTKAIVNTYKAHLISRGLAPATVNRHLAAIRKLAAEAADNELITEAHGNGIARVKGVKQQGAYRGNWLTPEQARTLINAPDTSTLSGLRDKALLNVLIYAGLRREEAASLQVEQIQLNTAGKWIVKDLKRKRGRVQTLTLPTPAKEALDNWTQAAGITSGYIFRRIRKGEQLTPDRITDVSVYLIVDKAAKTAGLEIAPHDLRRTFARLSLDGGADMLQIQHALGHASITTTEKYLGATQDETTAPGDFIDLG